MLLYQGIVGNSFVQSINCRKWKDSLLFVLVRDFVSPNSIGETKEETQAAQWSLGILYFSGG